MGESDFEWLFAVSLLGLRPHGRDAVREIPDDPFGGWSAHSVSSL